jgi:hypothetical protein
MSNMSELSIEMQASTARNEGPSALDDAAHRVAVAAIAYWDSKLDWSVLRDLLDRYRTILEVHEMCAEAHVRPKVLLCQVNALIADVYCNDSEDKYMELQRLAEKRKRILSVMDVL